MKRIIIALGFLLLFASSSFAAAFTSKATGNWSSGGQTTWNEVGVPGDGDTVSIGAHTITVDVNTTIGTSPNNTTTKAIDMTSASSVLSVVAGITLTVKGNIGHVNGSTHTQAAGSTVTFDNSGSGGSPVYTFINGGFSKFNFNGSSGSIATIQAISGQTFGMGVAWNTTVATFALFKRCSNLTITSINGSINISDSTFDTCAKLDISYTGTTLDLIFDRTVFTAGTNATDDLKLTATTATTSGTRRLKLNKFAKTVTYGASKSFTITQNYFGNGLANTAGATALSFRSNFFKHDGLLNGGNGALFPYSAERNYFVVDNSTGNPHFIAPTALLSADNVVSQNVFESQTPDLSDFGDCIIINGTATSGGVKVKGKNNIVLVSGYSGSSVGSGTLLTAFGTGTSATEFYRNTANVNTSAVGGIGKRGMFAFAEGNSTATIDVLKSNLAWGSSSGQGYFGERVAGTTKDLIVAAGADYNWTFNLSAGDNQRGYEDKAASNTLWTAGDAVAASVDTHQGTGDPQFYDSNRNLAAWATVRGYGAGDYAAALAALQADPTRTADLIAYIFDGLRVQNTSMRNAAHDGGAVGASNFYKARKVALVTAHRAALVKFSL